MNRRRVNVALPCFILYFLFSSLPLLAHPSTGLVVDSRNNVYFIYWGGTWKLDSREQLSRVHASDFHFMAIDTVGRFAAAHVPDSLRITPDGSRPALFTFPESPATFHSDGYLYMTDWLIGRIRVEQVRPNGT